MKKHKFTDIDKNDKNIFYNKKHYLRCVKCEIRVFKSMNHFHECSPKYQKNYHAGKIYINVRQGKVQKYNEKTQQLGGYIECLYTDEEWVVKTIII